MTDIYWLNLSFFGSKYSVLDSFSFAEFLRYYLVPLKSKDNDYQSQILYDNWKLIVLRIIRPTEIPMMLWHVKLKCYKVSYVLKYHIPSNHVHPEEYLHHMLMYIPFRDENKSKFNKSYIEKLDLSYDLETINLNHIKLEPYAIVVEDAVGSIRRPISIHLFSMKMMT